MAQKNTTGATISRLGALTVLTNNHLADNHLDGATRTKYRRQMREILNGKKGPDAQKVQVRSAQRCLAGGALISVDGVGIWGMN